MSFSRLLQNAPYYSPAAFSPSRKRQLQDDEPSSSTASALAKARRTRAARPLVDPYAALPAPEFDSFVDDVSSRIVNALTYEPNKDRRIRRGYADDEEYWLEMGGKPGEFVGNQTQEAVEGEDSAVVEPEVEEELDVEAAEPETEQVEDAMSEDVLDDIEAGETHPVEEGDFEEADTADQEDTDSFIQSLADHAPPPAPDSKAPSLFSQAAHNNQHITLNDLYPDLTSLDEDGSLQAAQAGPSHQNIQMQPGNLYPSLDQLQGEAASHLTVNENYQLDLLRQFNHDGFSGYAESTPQFLSTQTHGIEDLLDMAEKDAQEVNEAIQHIREEEEREEQLDNELLEVLEHDMPHEEMRVDSSEDDILVPLEQENDDEEEGGEELSDEEEALELPPSKQKRTSREASDVISIGSTSDEDEEEEEETEEEGDVEEVIEAENGAIVLDEEEEEEEDSGEENDSLEVTPPPPQASTFNQPGPSRQLFGQLDAPVASQSRLMSQKVRRRMDEDDLRTSGFDEEEAPVGSGSSDASDEQTREWQQFRRKAGKGQRAQDDQDAADRYFDDESDGQENEEDEDEEESDEGASGEDYAARSYRKMQERAAAGEFEDELDDQAIADEELQASRAEADLDERVPIPAFMKRDKETGEYDLRVGSSSEEDEDEEESEEEEEEEDETMEEPPEVAEEESEEDLKIEVLDEEEIGQVGEEVESLQPDDAASSLEAATSRILSEEVDEVIDLAQSPGMQLNTEEQVTYTTTTISVQEIIETSMATEEASTFAFAGLPPLPQSLADVADNLVNEAIEMVGEELDVSAQETIQAASAEAPVLIDETQQSEKDAERKRARRKSREPSLPAFTRTPRKSVEPSLVASMGVSPEQLSLSPKSVRPTKPQESTSTAVSTESVVPAQTEKGASAKELDEVTHVSHPVHFTEDHHHEPPPPELTEEELFSHPHVVKQDDEEMVGVDLTTDEMENHSAGDKEVKEENAATSQFTEDHHHEPPPPELTEEEHFLHDYPATQSKEPIQNVDLTTDEMENHSGAEEEKEEATLSTAHFTEDHHHEPPPPELTVEEHFTHDHSAAAPKEVTESIDLTVDEMESHSADEGEGEEAPTTTHFKEDHHFEPPPPELQQDSEPKIGEEILPETEPLAGIDMTTDEMEEHSSDEADVGPVHEIGYVNNHVFEPAPLPSEQPTEDEKVGEELHVPSPAAEEAEVVSHKVQPEVHFAPEESTQAEIANDESATFTEPASTPLATPSVVEQSKTTVVSPTKETATPTRAFNAIKPGLWDPSTPIRFGGRSLEAAVREAYYDPDRSANLKKSLEMDEAATESVQLKDEATPTPVQQQEETILPDELKRQEEDFVPLASDANEPEIAELDDDMTEDTPALVSSPGIRQPDGGLTKAVQEGDYIGDTVTDALTEDSELPPLEPEILLSVQEQDADDTPAESSASTSQSPVHEAEEASETTASATPTTTASQPSGVIPTVHIESSSEDSDDEHHVATSLLRSRAQYQSGTTPAKARRGRSRSRSTKTPSRKGKERASSVPDDEVEIVTADRYSEAEPVPALEEEEEETLQAEAGANDEVEVERATTPEKDSNGRNVITTHIVPGSPISATSRMEELEVTAMLAPRPSKPRFHRHGTSGSIHMFSPPSSRRGRVSPSSRSSTSRTSAEPVSGSSAAPVHPDAEHHPHATGATSGSPIQTRSQCTYRKLMIPNPYLGSINTPGRRISTRLARAAGAGEESTQHDYPTSFVFLVPGCVTADRKEQMLEGGIVDLGVASVEEEGSAMAIQSSEENESGLHVEGLPDSVVQSLVRVVGLEMFREGDCEILAPLLPQGPGSPARTANNGTERKRRRESDMMSPPGHNKRLR